MNVYMYACVGQKLVTDLLPHDSPSCFGNVELTVWLEWSAPELWPVSAHPAIGLQGYTNTPVPG